jgi:uncharacterized membrane protein
MKIFILLLFMFIFGAFGGYLIEVLFRRFVTAKKWVNPGFMKGPWLPLYGFGVLVMFGVIMGMLHLIPTDIPLYNPRGFYSFRVESGASVWDLIPIGLMTIGMISLEFIAGMIFVNGFKIRLWDYTNMRGNIKGVICPVFNLIWFGVAVLFYYGINPFVYDFSSRAYLYMFGSSVDGVSTGGGVAHFGTIFFLGLIYGIFLIDLIKSLNLFNKISKFVKENGFVAKYEDLKAKQKEMSNNALNKIVDTIPSSIKAVIEESKNKAQNNAYAKKAKSWLYKMVFVDPNKKKVDNYDESGRPVNIEDEK